MPAQMSEEGDVIIMGTAADLGVSEGRIPALPTHKHNLRSRFELIKTLGEGTYGKVKLAVEKTTGEHVSLYRNRFKTVNSYNKNFAGTSVM